MTKAAKASKRWMLRERFPSMRLLTETYETRSEAQAKRESYLQDIVRVEIRVLGGKK